MARNLLPGDRVRAAGEPRSSFAKTQERADPDQEVARSRFHAFSQRVLQELYEA
jgi:hypothetical protein